MSCNLCKDAVDVVHVVLGEFPTAEIDHVTSTWSSKVFLPFVSPCRASFISDGTVVLR